MPTPFLSLVGLDRFEALGTAACERVFLSGLNGYHPSCDYLRQQGEVWGLLNGSVVTDGHLTPPDGPGWGAEWDEHRFESLIVEEC